MKKRAENSHRRIKVLHRLGMMAMVAAFSASLAQAQLTLPQASQKATLEQTIGLAEVRVTYSRPKVNDREIWGGIVPYDQVWRVGANENTVIEFSHDVEIEGQPLAAGTYGLHAIPGQKEWTVIFSNNSTSWGSFSYSEAEDALRVKVKPRENPHHELLTLDLVDQSNEGATLAINWASLQVPVQIAIDNHGIVLANIRNELRSSPGFSWVGWNQAANFSFQNNINHEEALGWVNQSIQIEERFENLLVKSQLLGQMDRKEEAEAAMANALQAATPLNLHNYARQLIAQGEPKKAMEIFKMNSEKNPDAWFIDIGMARGYSALGEYKKAAESMRAAIPKAPEQQRQVYENLAKQLDNGESIN